MFDGSYLPYDPEKLSLEAETCVLPLKNCQFELIKCVPPYLGTIHIIRQQRGGRVWSEKWQFLLIYSSIYADVGGWADVIYGSLLKLIIFKNLICILEHILSPDNFIS